MKKLSSHQIRQILVCVTQNRSYRELEDQLGVSKASISRIFNASVRGDKSPRELLKLSDNELEEFFYPTSGSKFVEPDWPQVHSQLQRRGVTLQMLYEKFKAQTSRPVYTYTSFSRGYARWKADDGVRQSGGNIERISGERIEIDFAGDKIKWIDPDGVLHESKLFVATLPYSCMLFTEAFNDETQPSWIYGIVDALEYFGGVPRVLVMDNAAPLVRVPNWQEAEIQYAIRSLCTYYGMQPWACKPRTPKQKNRVEAAVNDVERWIVTQMNLDHPAPAYDLDDLNRQIRKRLDELNDKPFRGRGITDSRRSRFEQEERCSLTPLPRLPFEPGQWKVLVADKAHCIRISSDGGHRYSVPAEYVGKKVVVRVCRAAVEIYDSETMKRLGTHQRYTSTKGPKTHLLDEHLTDAEKHYRRTSREWIELFVKKGMTEHLATDFVAYLTDKKGNFPSGLTCGAVFGLFRYFAPSVIRKAVAIALEDDYVSYKYIRQLCEQIDFANKSNGKLTLGASDQAPKFTVCENIRGNYE